MKITYDPKANAMIIRFQEGKYEISKEIAEGIIIDFTKKGKIISMEILNVTERIPIKDIQDITIGMPIKSAKAV